MLWIGRSGAPWRDLPERFGPAPAARLELGLPPIQTMGQSGHLATGF
ncbi:transposase [Spirosoma luteum]